MENQVILRKEEKDERFEIFSKENLGSVRTVISDNVPWFLIKDVAKILGVKNHNEIPGRLDEDEVGRYYLPHPQNAKKIILATFTNESGLYTLIVTSRKKEAKIFRKWITSEVIPSIRRTGTFGYSEKNAISKKQELLLKIMESETPEQIAMAVGQYNIEYVRPLEINNERYIKYLDKNGTLTSSQIAGEMGISAVTLNMAMHYAGIIVKEGRRWKPSKDFSGKKIMKLVNSSFTIKPENLTETGLEDPLKNEIERLEWRWTFEGAELIERILLESGIISRDEKGMFHENSEKAKIFRKIYADFKETGKRSLKVKSGIIIGLNSIQNKMEIQ